MALGKKCRSLSMPKQRGGGFAGDDGEEGWELGLVSYARAFGRKRILISNNGGCDYDSSPRTPLKKLCGMRNSFSFSSSSSSSFSSYLLSSPSSTSTSSSSLEALPQDILIRILCGVNHEDLNQLSNVSKSIREATQIAKQWYFAYSTPKKVKAFRGAIDFDQNSIETGDIEAPNAPRHTRSAKSRLFGKKLDSIAVNLFN